MFTLEEYEAQRKAKMSELLGKKTARAVEPVEAGESGGGLLRRSGVWRG